jgi:hypothetical protein
VTRNLFGTVATMGVIACFAGCDAQMLTQADQCFVIDLNGADGQQLLPPLDAFAHANVLSPDKQTPFMIFYTLHADGRKAALVSYSPAVDDKRAQLALYRFDGPGSERLRFAFKDLVDREIRPRFGVKTCAEVPEVGIPSASR